MSQAPCSLLPFERLAQGACPARRSARQGHHGRRRLHEAGAVSPPPPGTAPPKASAAATILSRSGMSPPALTVVATALATLFLASPLHAGPMEDRAKAAADAARAKSGDSESLQQNYLVPGLSHGDVKTLDNRQSFKPNIACQKSATLLDILVQPSPTGDLGWVRIGRDKDLDGSIDTSLNLPVPVSGLCANGIISCSPGTWNQCRYLRWTVDGANDLSLAEVDMPQLVGCYCLNNSCGSNLAWSNMASVLGDLGGGVVGALTTSDPRFGILKAEVNGPTIRYVGAQATACSSDPVLPQTSYRANPGLLAGDAAMAGSGNGLFQKLTRSPIGTGTVQESRSCVVERQVDIEGATIDDVISRVSGGYATNLGPDSVDFLIGSPSYHSLEGGSCRVFDFRMTLNVSDPDRIRAVILSQIMFDDWVQIRVDGSLVYSDLPSWTSLGSPPSGCERSKTWNSDPGTDLKPYLTRGNHEIWLRVAVGNQGEVSATIHADVDTSCRTREQVVDSCSGLAINPKCTMRDEAVDGVATFRNGVGTGLRPLPQTRILGNGRCAIQLSRDFFRKNRSYACQIDTGAFPAPDTSRGAYIIDRSTETVLADRRRQSEGSFAETTRAFGVPDRGTVAACEPICKSQAPRDNVGAAPAGVVGAQQNSPVGVDTFFHRCSADNVCPLGPGEALTAPCGCLDDFPEAVMMMQTVRLAGADLVCTRTAP